jgi:hypothetical protein
MKTTSYSLSRSDIVNVCKTFSIEMSKAISARPNASTGDLKLNAKNKAMFGVLVSDGLVSIRKDIDSTLTFADHAGDMFSQKENPDCSVLDLKTDERRERARFNKHGTFFHTLVVMGEDVDSIGGFVGDSFYGSGYDNNFYSNAIEKIASAHPQFYQLLNEIDLTQVF